MTASLLVQSSGIWAHNHQLDKLDVCKIGRLPENTVRIKEQEVSGHHAEIRHDGERWYLVDLDSGNGTFLNDHRIQGQAALRNGDIVRIGNAEIVFRDQESAVSEDIWGKTSLNFMKMRFSDEEIPKASDQGPLRLPGVYDEGFSAAQAAPDHVGRCPDFSGRAKGVETPPPSDASHPPAPAAGGAPTSETHQVWAIQTLAKILGDMAVQRNKSHPQLLASAMEKLRDAAVASYGFLIFVHPDTRRWAVQVCFDGSGLLSPDALTDFASAVTRESIANAKVLNEVEHPVANQPFVSVPILKDGQVRGAVYLERKTGNPTFAPGQVQLAKDLGSYLVELNTQVESAGAIPPSSPSFAAAAPPLVDKESTHPGSRSSAGQTDFSQFYADGDPDPPPKTRPVLSGDDNRLPSKDELFGDEEKAHRSRMKRFEYAALIPIDQRQNLRVLAKVYSHLHGVDPSEADLLVVDSKGLLADSLSYDRLVELRPRLEEFAEHFRIAQIVPDRRPGDVAIPSSAAMGKLELTAGSMSLPWSSIRMVSCGRIDRKPVIDLFAPEDRIHVRLTSTKVHFPALVDMAGVHPNEAAREILLRIKQSCDELICSQTVRALLSGKTPKPQKFGGLRDYNRYNTWLLLSCFADKVELSEFR